jgi:hypothetical protein
MASSVLSHSLLFPACAPLAPAEHTHLHMRLAPSVELIRARANVTSVAGNSRGMPAAVRAALQSLLPEQQRSQASECAVPWAAADGQQRLHEEVWM